MITPYGYDNAFLMLGIGAGLLGLAMVTEHPWLRGIVMALGIVVIAFTLWFFRDPERPLNAEAAANASVLVSPVDGNVTEIVNEPFVDAFGGPAQRITVFLSPVNLHVNRYPIGGRVSSVAYVAGKYLMAFNPKASEENERSIITIDTPYGPVVMKQITGFLARRVVYDCTVGTVAKPGARFGMMKFGSRMDILVAPSATICTRVGETVRSSETILARLAGPAAAQG
ncbi:MAG: phosphatidylserine decarboxylase family protein [Candidatus Kapabacteria bacterium]|nr:phosphatidylserine decarboxylase family protein [Candidatus Kapabacteria bacterium]